MKFVRFKHSENEYYGNIEDKIIAQWSAAPWDGGKKLNISYIYYAIERKYLGDGKTKINDNNSKKEKIGITFNKIK